MMKRILILLMLSVFAFSCNADEVDQKKIKSAAEVEKSDKIKGTDLYRNPVTADQPLKEGQAAKMDFEEYVFDFGSIKEGENVEHTFKFTNSGKAPLVITNARGNCGCTVPEWPKTPIVPGASGEIKVVFNSKGKQGKQEKEVIITANTIPNKTKLKITANVVN
jgi:hypothetical protein